MADKLFTLGRDTNTIYGYKMNTPDDLSTLVYDYGNSLHVEYSNIETLVGEGIQNASYDNVNFYVGSQDGTQPSITFNNDGTKMYMLGYSNKRVYQYSLSAAFDISTCSYDNVNFYVGSQDSNPNGITFNNDGTKMYMVGPNSDRVYQYSLSTAFDLSTCSYDNVNFYVGQDTAAPWDIKFNNNGTKMYILGSGNDRVYQYSLSTAFDLSTCSYDNVSFSLASQDINPHGIAFNNDGTKMYILGNGNDRVYQYSLSTAFNISTCSYYNVSFSVASQDADPRGITFNNDGTKMYILGTDSDRVYQYSVNGSINSTYNRIVEESSPATFAFNETGTKLYVYGETLNRIYQYNLSTAYKLSSATYNTYFDCSSFNGNSITEIVFKNDGTSNRLFILTDTRRVYSTPFASGDDLPLGTIGSAFNASTQITISGGSLGVNDAGTKFYITNINNNTVYEYTMSTPYSMSGASYTGNSFNLGTQDATVRGVGFRDDGLKMFMLGNNTDKVYQYSTQVNPIGGYVTDISSFGLEGLPNVAYDKADIPTTETAFGATGRCLPCDHEITDVQSATNTQMVYNDGSDRVPDVGDLFIFYHSGGNENQTLSSVSGVNIAASPISGASYDNVSFSVSSQDGNPYGIAFNSDGTKMYMVGTTNDKVHQYSLATAFDLSTCSYDNVSFSVFSQDITPTGIEFNNDGTKMYITGSSTNSVHQYSLATAFDISTCSYDNVSFSVSSQDSNLRGVAFNNDGTKMYMVGSTNDKVYQYSLATAFDLSTCSYDGVSFYVGSQDETPIGITFNNDGTKMYMIGAFSKSVNQYSLATAFDLSTCSYDGVSFYVGSQDTSSYYIAFNNDGTKMYMVGTTNDKVHQYSVNGSVNNMTQYTVTYPAISQAPDTTYGNPLMKARRTALTPSGYTLSAGDVVLTYDKVEQQGREIAFRHDIKNVDDVVKVTKFDFEKLQ